MDPFFGSFPLTISEKSSASYRHPLNRISSSFTPLDIDFNDKLNSMILYPEIVKNLEIISNDESSLSIDESFNTLSELNSPNDKNTLTDKSIIDSLFDSDSELSEFDDSHAYLTRKKIQNNNDKLDGKIRKKKEGVLTNPFKTPNMEQAEEDWISIKKYTGDLDHGYKKKTTNGTAKSLICTNGKRSSRNSDNVESDDNCAVCLGKGKVLCCDSCPRVFHVHCLDEVLEYDPLPEFWECKSCRKDEREQDWDVPDDCDSDMFQFLFGELLDSVSCLNPRVFQLPEVIRNSYENVATHPLTGDFIDTRETEFIDFNVPSQIKESNPTIKRNQPLGDSDQLLNAYCYQCSRSNLKLQQTSLLSSYSVHQPSIGLQLQSPNSELIKCDFCPLYWHLDCLNPPLTCIPPQLRENEIEIVNLRSINSIKSKIWGKASIESDADPLNTSRSFVDGLFSIRKKWMCPCHIQDFGHLQPKGWKWCRVYEDPNLESNSEPDDIYLFSKSSKNNGRIEIINEKETDKLFQEVDLSKRKAEFQSINRFEINGIKYKVPEKRIKLDFLSKTCDSVNERKRKYRYLPNGQVEFDQTMLDAMFPGLDTKYNIVSPVNSIDSLLEAARMIN